MSDENENIDSGMFVGLEGELLAELTMEFKKIDPNFDSDLLLLKLRSAMRSVKLARRYFNNPQYYDTEERIENDMRNYYENIHDLASIRYCKIGAAGEESHSESGVSRTYYSEKDCLAGVLPISKIG